MSRFFVSDLHFSHRNVIAFCKRPYESIEEMDQAIINQWNSQVNPEDEVYFLGDFGVNKKKSLDAELVNQLNGRKHLILGNHDSFFMTLHKSSTSVSKRTKCEFEYRRAGWESVDICKKIELKDGRIVWLTHLPPDNECDSRYKDQKLENDPNNIYLHGHLHGHYIKKNNMIDVAFDTNLKLWTEEEIIDIINDERDFIPTRLTEFYKEDNLFLAPFEQEVFKKNLRKAVDNDLVLYNYTDQCTYDRNWNDVTRHARGIIFHRDTGKIVAIPFPKFFNIGEQPETRLENLPDEPYVVTEKMDGSLGIIFNHKGEWRVATRGAFFSEQAIKGQEILKKYDMTNIPENLTLLVEIIYPENKIVVNYGDEEKLVLLSMVERESMTELEYAAWAPYTDYIGMEPVKVFNHTIEEMIELQKTIPKDEEGFVVRFESGLRVKIKGHEYLRIHKLISYMSPISFWEIMIDGKVRVDYLEELPEEYRKEADEIMEVLEGKYRKLQDEVNWTVDQVLKSVGIGDINDREYKKKIGLHLQGGKLEHAGVVFPSLLGKLDVVDRYIKKQIRPDGNRL